jgi:hypothetical protein
MAEPVRIEVENEAQALDLSLALAVRGLTGNVLFEHLRWAVEVGQAREDSRRLLAEVSEAVVDWLCDRGYESATVHAGDRTFLLRGARTHDPANVGVFTTA